MAKIEYAQYCTSSSVACCSCCSGVKLLPLMLDVNLVTITRITPSNTTDNVTSHDSTNRAI